MTRTARLTATFLLAVLGPVSFQSIVWAQDTPWKMDFLDGPTEDQPRITLVNLHDDGEAVVFICLPDKPTTFFGVGVTTKKGDFYPDGDVEVSWGVDNSELSDEIWQSNISSVYGGVLAEGQNAYKFTRAVATAKNQILFRTPNGSVTFDATGSGDALGGFLAFCGLFGLVSG